MKTTKTRRKPIRPEIASLLRLRKMLMVRHAGLTNRVEATRQTDLFKAAEKLAERSGVAWSISDLDYVVEDLRSKK